MFLATGGINTHKGAIFTLGIICGAVGRLWSADRPCQDPERILKECAAMASVAVNADLETLDPETACTAGQRLYLEQGVIGIRGEAAQGFPSILKIALPALKKALATGRSRNDAGAIALLHLIAQGTDTNMISRRGLVQAYAAAEWCRMFLTDNPLPEMEEIAEIDQEFIQRNLSPGGCADLLAAALFLLRWET